MNMGDPIKRSSDTKKLNDSEKEIDCEKSIRKNLPPAYTRDETESYEAEKNSRTVMYPHLHNVEAETASNFTEVRLESPSQDWRKSTRSVKAKLSYVLAHDVLQDVIFIVGKEKERIRAHKFMLLLTSSVFEQMFLYSDEINKGVSIPDVDPSAFKEFLKFIYTDKFDVTTQNAMHSLYIAKKFDVPALTERCIELLKTNINERNVVTIFQRAREINEHELSKIAFGFLLKNAEKVIKSDDFNELSYENLCYVLERDDLKVEELSLFQATLRWAEEKCRRDELDGTPEDLRYELKRALSLIRFPLLTSEEFTMYVAPREILSMTEMLELYKYFSVSQANRYDYRPGLPPLSFQTKKRGTAPKMPIYTMQRLHDMGYGPWPCNGKLMQIRFMVDRPISLRGYGFYGSYEAQNPNYNVDIYLESAMYFIKVQASEVIQLSKQGGFFQVNFNDMVAIQPNSWYEAGYKFKGPNTCCGSRQLEKVSMACGDKGTVTFSFGGANSSEYGGEDNQANFQLPQILFSV